MYRTVGVLGTTTSGGGAANVIEGGVITTAGAGATTTGGGGTPMLTPMFTSVASAGTAVSPPPTSTIASICKIFSSICAIFSLMALLPESTSDDAAKLVVFPGSGGLRRGVGPRVKDIREARDDRRRGPVLHCPTLK